MAQELRKPLQMELSWQLKTLDTKSMKCLVSVQLRGSVSVVLCCDCVLGRTCERLCSVHVQAGPRQPQLLAEEVEVVGSKSPLGRCGVACRVSEPCPEGFLLFLPSETSSAVRG